MLGQLNEQQSFNLLTSQALGRLGCTDGRFPYVVPVTYHYDGEYIYGQTNEGSKLSMLRLNPNVCFEVDSMTDMANWQSVIVTGKFEELHNGDASRASEKLFRSLFTLMTSRTIHPHEHEVATLLEDQSRIKRVMYRIKVESITGRFEKQ